MLEGRRRILVIGPSGAGKSTLARRLGAITGLPVIHLDRVYWNAGWVPTPDEEFRSRLAALLREPEWIIDGAYVTTQEERLSYSGRPAIPSTCCVVSAARGRSS